MDQIVRLIREHVVHVNLVDDDDGGFFSTVTGLSACDCTAPSLGECLARTDCAIRAALDARARYGPAVSAMRRGNKIRVYGHTLTGRLICEGDALLVRHDASFDGHPSPFELRNAMRHVQRNLECAELKPQRGPYVRWWVQFPGEGEPEVSRWVRTRDLIVEQTVEPPD